MGNDAAVGRRSTCRVGHLAEHTSDPSLQRRCRAPVGRDFRPRRPPRSARPQNDTWIAACCLIYDLPLATLNAKDFKDFVEHEGLTLIGT